MRFIDADQFIEFAHRSMMFGVLTESEYEKFTKMIQWMPTVTMKPATKAEWVGLEYDGYADGNPVYDSWECSHCHCEWNGEYDTLPTYCPDCGAEMGVYQGE